MALFNYATKEITLKIVYYGPGLSGKTTNLQYLHASVLQPESTGKLLSLATETDRTLFFDFLPVELGKIRDFTIRFQLYTVPGQVRYNATRKVVLKGADAVIFVADSQREMREQNIESFDNMRENLVSNNINPDEVPVVLQFNKRDLRNISSVAEINEYLNPNQYPVVEASAISGAGVEESFKLITRLMLRYISKKHKIEIQQPAQEKAAVHAAAAAPAVEAKVIPAPEPPPPPQPATLTVEEAIEIFPDTEDETIEVAEAYVEDSPAAIVEWPEAEEAPSPAPPPFIPPQFASEVEPNLPQEPGRGEEPEPAYESVPEPVFGLPREPKFEPAPEPRREPEPEPAYESVPEPVFRLPREPKFEPAAEPALGSQPEPKPEAKLEYHDDGAVPAVSLAAVSALTDEMRQMREALNELQKIGTVVEEVAQANGILTDLKNTVYILSKEVRELKDIHRGQEETNSLLHSIASKFEGLKETNSLLRSIASSFEGTKKSKGWFRF